MTFQMIGGDTNNLEAVVNQVNQNIAQLKVQDTTNIFKDDTGTRRVLLGKGKDNFYGLKVSQEGTDVYDGSDEDMVFNSDNNIFKIVDSGETSLTGSSNISAGDTQTVTVAHNLGYTPALLIYVNAVEIVSMQGGNGIMPLPISYLMESGLVFCVLQARVDDTNLYIDLVCNNGTGNSLSIYTWDFKYYLLQETAN